MSVPSHTPSPAPRRASSPTWLDLRLVLGVVLVLGAVLVGALVFARASHTNATVAVTRDLAAGTVLTAGDVRIVQTRVPGDQVYLGSTHDAIGKKLGRAVTKDELLPAAAIGSVGAQTTITVPFAAGDAPELRAGQRIEVWMSTAQCVSVVLLSDVTIQSVRTDTGGSFGGGDGGQDVVLGISPAQARRVVAALGIDDAKFRAGVLTGGTPATSAAPVDTPTAPGGLPDDLAGCVSTTATR